MIKLTEKEIIVAIEGCLDAGYKNKNEIFSTVSKQLEVPRPTVRRVGRKLREMYQKRVRILQADSSYQRLVDYS